MDSKKLYLLVFSAKVDRDALTKTFEKNPDNFWFYSIPNSIFLQSKLTSKEIHAIFESVAGNERCIVTEVINYWGSLPKDHWEHFKGIRQGT